MPVVNKKNPVIEAEEDAAPAEEQRIQVYVEAVGRIDAVSGGALGEPA